VVNGAKATLCSHPLDRQNVFVARRIVDLPRLPVAG
jgi:hypothetical protein